jgi:hypothetical protein
VTIADRVEMPPLHKAATAVVWQGGGGEFGLRFVFTAPVLSVPKYIERSTDDCLSVN